MAQLDNKTTEGIMEVLREYGITENITLTLEHLLNELMVTQRKEHLNVEPYERSFERQDQANGFKPKQFNTRMGKLNLRVPQTRHTDFYPACIEKGLRSERALFCAIAEMYIQGVSTRKVTRILDKMCGCQVSSTQVSRITTKLDEDVSEWRNRPLGLFTHLMMDARYEKIRYGGKVRDCAVIWATGIREDGKREVLGVTVALSEAEIFWRDFLKSLTERGLHGVAYIVSDDHSGLKKALKSVFPNVAWQRCQTHLARNAQDYVSQTANKDPVAHDLRDIFLSSSAASAQDRLNQFRSQWAQSEPKLSAWAESNIPQGFAAFELPSHHRKHLRTTNPVERINQELKRRSTVVRIFPNEAACLRLMSAILLEYHDDWVSGRTVLPML
ncbi:MAG: IS256 family transposase [Alphaproteobacteria bacterium]|nr:IS256 family transposase [Alphaproteobacteria bacterium]